MNDAFSNLSFSTPASPPAQAQPKPSAFSNLGNLSARSTSQVSSPPSTLSGGSFFDPQPVQKPVPQPAQPSRTFSSSSGFGAFDSAPGISPLATTNTSSGLGDLFDFSTPSSQPTAPKQTVASPIAQQSSVFNLSAQPASPPQPQTSTARVTGWSNNDAWGSNDAWSSTPAKPSSPTINKPLPPLQSSAGDFGWGSVAGGPLANQSIVPGGAGGFNTASTKAPKVSADEDFGGWSTAAPAAGTQPAKPAVGFATSEDLFTNVWE